jgi:hydroxymethylbilane synthase
VQLLALRPDLRVEPLRGNLQTRLRKLDEGGFDAIVLAAAGLKRLGLGHRIRQRLPQLVPCAGQGALGIEVKGGQAAWLGQLAKLSHGPTALACGAERAVSRALGGSCSVPLAAHAVWRGAELHLEAAFGTDSLGTDSLGTDSQGHPSQVNSSQVNSSRLLRVSAQHPRRRAPRRTSGQRLAPTRCVNRL